MKEMTDKKPAPEETVRPDSRSCEHKYLEIRCRECGISRDVYDRANLLTIEPGQPEKPAPLSEDEFQSRLLRGFEAYNRVVDENATLRDKVSVLTRKHRHLVALSDDEVDDHDVEEARLQSRINYLEVCLKNVKSRLVAGNVEVGSYDSQSIWSGVEQVVKERDEAQATNATLREKVNLWMKSHGTVRERHRRDTSNLRAQLDTLRAEVEEQNRVLNEIADVHGCDVDVVETVAVQYRRLSDERSEDQQATIATIRTERDESRAALKDATKERETLSVELVRCRDNLGGERNELRKENSHLLTENATLRRQVHHLLAPEDKADRARWFTGR